MRYHPLTPTSPAGIMFHDMMLAGDCIWTDLPRSCQRARRGRPRKFYPFSQDFLQSLCIDLRFRCAWICLMYFMYIIESATSRKWYIGSTMDLIGRLNSHNKGLNRSTNGFSFSKLSKKCAHTQFYGEQFGKQFYSCSLFTRVSTNG